MADSTINGLTPLTGANVVYNTDELAIWDDSASTSKKITASELQTFITAGPTHLEGETMYFNPDNLGVYANTAAVLAATPVAGTIKLINDYDVSVHGIIVILQPVTLEGSGHGYQPSGGFQGTQILNNASNIDHCITVNDTTGIDLHGVHFKNLYINHQGQAQNAYAIDIMDTTFCWLDNVHINCNRIGYGGIRHSKNISTSFFIELRNCRINNFTCCGFYEENPSGSKNRIINCHIQSDFSAASGAADADNADNLEDSSEDFIADYLAIGHAVYNTTDGTVGYIDAITSGTVLSIIDNFGNALDLFPLGTESYVIGPVAAVWVETEDMFIQGGQINCDNAPSIVCNVPVGFGKDIKGVIIDQVLSEENQPIVVFQSSDPGYFCRDCIVRNPAMAFVNADRVLVKFDHAISCRLELPYGYSAPIAMTSLGNICEFTANAKHNTAYVSGTFAVLPYIDNGINNTVVVSSSSDKQLLQSLKQWPLARQITESSESLYYPMIRNAATNTDGILGAWAPVVGGGAWKEPDDYTSCVMWLDASDTATMFSNLAGTTPATDTDPVLVWKDKTASVHEFNTQIAITSIVEANPTSVDFSTTGHGFLDGDSITISGVTVNSGVTTINGTHTVAFVDYNTVELTGHDSSGADYDNDGIATSDTNTPTLDTDVGGNGFPGISFDGVRDFFNGTAISLGADKTATIFVVFTPASTNSSNTIFMLGRDWAVDTMRYNASATNIKAYGHFGSVSSLPGSFSPIDTGETCVVSSVMDATNIISTIGMTEIAGQIGTGSTGVNLTKDAAVWQVGASGKSNNTGTSLLMDGHIHAIAMFDDTLTAQEIGELTFYFNNKFKGNVID